MKNVYEECPTFESEKWLLRFVEKATGKAIGTIEMIKRLSEDAFNTSDILQPDIGSLMKNR